MSWLNGKFLAFDLETHDRDPLVARIVTATTILIDPTTGAKDVTNWLSDVDGEEIPPETTKIHGITTEDAHEHGQPAGEVAAQVADTIDQAWNEGIPVIGHNVGYDFTVLDCELGLWKMARKYPALERMSLDELYDAQVVWFREQALSLAKHFRSEGNYEHVSTEWPIRLAPAEVAS